LGFWLVAPAALPSLVYVETGISARFYRDRFFRFAEEFFRLFGFKLEMFLSFISVEILLAILLNLFPFLF
jgi:hypothetical protein